MDDGEDFSNYEERANLLEKDDNDENDALKMESEHGENFANASTSNTDDENVGQSSRAKRTKLDDFSDNTKTKLVDYERHVNKTCL